MIYDASAIEHYFDEFGWKEFERHDASPVERLKFELHRQCLIRHVARGSRVLEIGPGAGRFTQLLAERGCRVVLVDISAEQLRLNERRARKVGYHHAIEASLQADVCDLSSVAHDGFDAVVAFGGPFSYVLDRRDEAMAQCLAKVRPGGSVLLSVMSKWGSTHALLDGVLGLPAAEIAAVLASGDITAETSTSSRGHYLHLFTGPELRAFLESHALTVEFMGASNAVSTNWGDLLADKALFDMALRIEEQATQEPGLVDAGTHLLAVARVPPHKADA
ncbi:MAG: class I SAM-dependent methyltransferase [Bacteroidota bacterium]